MAAHAQNLRDILSLARMLRRFAQEHTYDANHELFVATSMALEARAHFLAAMPEGTLVNLERDLALHTPVNLLV